ncbi:NAD-dependent epimerase/dehydratase family protein [Hafnia paralvei]|uniref:NAD-dependent epimerase/dehydratase family protein n=1 Tax=Hafnia paralvei TaxID=546367 RepID=UPI003C2B92FC
MANFLVMGAGGFIGQHLTAELLRQGEQVTAIGHEVHMIEESERLNIVSGEIDPELLGKLEKPKYIYFLLGGSSVASSINCPVGDFNKTFQPLTALIEKLKYDWIDSHLIFISSAAVYGNNASQSTSITSVCKPLSVYGLHKLLAEQYIEFHQRNFDIKAKIIRPFSIYGPGLKKQLIWDALCKIKSHQHEYFGSGLEERDWVHIDDLVTLFIGIAENFDDFPDIINAGYGHGVKIKDVVGILYKLKKVNGQPQFINKNKIGDPKHLACDAYEQTFMVKYQNKSLVEGLTEVVAWFDNFNS